MVCPSGISALVRQPNGGGFKALSQPHFDHGLSGDAQFAGFAVGADGCSMFSKRAAPSTQALVHANLDNAPPV